MDGLDAVGSMTSRKRRRRAGRWQRRITRVRRMGDE